MNVLFSFVHSFPPSSTSIPTTSSSSSSSSYSSSSSSSSCSSSSTCHGPHSWLILSLNTFVVPRWYFCFLPRLSAFFLKFWYFCVLPPLSPFFEVLLLLVEVVKLDAILNILVDNFRHLCEVFGFDWKLFIEHFFQASSRWSSLGLADVLTWNLWCEDFGASLVLGRVELWRHFESSHSSTMLQLFSWPWPQIVECVDGDVVIFVNFKVF